LVQDAARRARAGGGTLGEALAADPAVTRYLSPAEIDRCLSPEHYVGASRVFVARVLERFAANQQPLRGA
jgi:adenylosuccinate lyase